MKNYYRYEVECFNWKSYTIFAESFGEAAKAIEKKYRLENFDIVSSIKRKKMQKPEVIYRDSDGDIRTAIYPTDSVRKAIEMFNEDHTEDIIETRF